MITQPADIAVGPIICFVNEQWIITSISEFNKLAEALSGILLRMKVLLPLHIGEPKAGNVSSSCGHECIHFLLLLLTILFKDDTNQSMPMKKKNRNSNILCLAKMQTIYFQGSQTSKTQTAIQICGLEQAIQPIPWQNQDTCRCTQTLKICFSRTLEST